MRNGRIKRSRLQTIYLKARTVAKDNEGVPTESFGEAVEMKAEVWPVSARRQVEMYGDRASGISNARIQGAYTIISGAPLQIQFENGSTLKIGDGVCVNVGSTGTPDYRVLTITPYRPVHLEIERI